jgi:hypothetical protein
MKTIRVMSLAAATVFALGLAGSAVAQTPATPAPAPATAPAQPTPPAKGGDMQMEKKAKKDGKAADKQHSKKKHAAAKKAEGDVKATTPETKAPEVKK